MTILPKEKPKEAKKKKSIKTLKEVRPFLEKDSFEYVRKELKKIHGMPPEGYICPICNGDAEHVKGRGNTKNGSWVLDHCHDTDTFRGWLCHKCNRALGGFDDDIEFLKRAIRYVEDHLKRTFLV